MRQDYAGLMVCLARQPQPDTSAYADPELVWRLDKKHHVASSSPRPAMPACRS